jgi:diguanylate cyclase
MTDGLTGVFNRSAFDTHLTKLIDRNMITPIPFSLLLLDIDNFKQINDTYGHLVGDRVIMAVAQHSKELIRKDDLLARYGGEEFALILHATSMRHGLKKGRAICKRIAETRYHMTAKDIQTSLSFTVSIGVSTFQPGDTMDSIVSRADKALYEAKRLGKNRALSEKRVM